jgi:hypothetical protein
MTTALTASIVPLVILCKPLTGRVEVEKRFPEIYFTHPNNIKGSRK